LHDGFPSPAELIKYTAEIVCATNRIVAGFEPNREYYRKDGKKYHH